MVKQNNVVTRNILLMHEEKTVLSVSGLFFE
jgi:hypothetical protein